MAAGIDTATEEIVESMRNLVLSLALVLVDDGASVSVKATPHDDGTILMLTVAPRDLGGVIGKQGQTAHSLRVILGAASRRYQQRFNLDISAATSSLPGGTA